VEVVLLVSAQPPKMVRVYQTSQLAFGFAVAADRVASRSVAHLAEVCPACPPLAAGVAAVVALAAYSEEVFAGSSAADPADQWASAGPVRSDLADLESQDPVDRSPCHHILAVEDPCHSRERRRARRESHADHQGPGNVAAVEIGSEVGSRNVAAVGKAVVGGRGIGSAGVVEGFVDTAGVAVGVAPVARTAKPLSALLSSRNYV